MKTTLINKLVAGSVLGLILVVPQSHAFLPTVTSLENQAKKIIMKERASNYKVKTKDDQNSCAQFAGTWKGTCEENGTKRESEFKLEQTACSSIASISKDESGNQQRTTIDLTGMGIKSETQSGVFFSLSYALAGKWNSDKQVITVDGSALVNSPFMSSLQKMDFSIQMMKDGNDLVTFNKSTGNSDGDHDTSCRYQLVK